MVNVSCPHCGREFDDEIEDYDDSSSHETECPDCEKVFGYTISISIQAIEYELPCGGQDGDGAHEWKPIIGYPKEYFKNRFMCSYCGLEKTIGE